jgi:hypothetical protein
MGKAPKAPDPYAQAAAQRGENIWASQYNTIGQNANQITPYGTVTNAPGTKIPIYDQSGKVTGYGTQWNQTTALSPQEQAIFNQEQSSRLGLGKFANQQIGQLTDVLGKPFDTKGLPDWQLYGEGPALEKAQYENTDRKAIEDAMMSSYYRGVNPQQERENTQLAARGMGAPGSEMAYAVGNQRGDAAGEATRQAYLASGEESRAQAGEARSKAEAINKVLQQGWLNANQRADQQNTVRGGMFGERQQTRNQIVNEIAALMGGGQVMVPQAQGFQGSAINPFDIAGAENQAYANKMSNYTNKQSGLFGIGGGILKMAMPILGGMIGGPVGAALGGAASGALNR